MRDACVMRVFVLECSVSCGRGARTREVACVNAEGRALAENMCGGKRPAATDVCDMGSCAKTWFFTHWSQQVSYCVYNVTYTVESQLSECLYYEIFSYPKALKSFHTK